MAITFYIDGAKEQMEKFSEKARAMLKKQFKIVGEEAVRTAVLNGSYTDRTKNLRSSISYRFRDLKDGEVWDSVSVQGQPNEKGGIEKARAMLDKLMAQDSTEMTLIVVAGMEYAEYVENKYGKDVLASAKLKAEERMRKLIQVIKEEQ